MFQADLKSLHIRCLALSNPATNHSTIAYSAWRIMATQPTCVWYWGTELPATACVGNAPLGYSWNQWAGPKDVIEVEVSQKLNRNLIWMT
jgi:hypothetical protein